MPGHTPDGFDYLDAAHEMAATGRPTLARLLAEEPPRSPTTPTKPPASCTASPTPHPCD